MENVGRPHNTYIPPTEPSDEAIRACEGCTAGGEVGEYYFTPSTVFLMGIEQAFIKREDRRGAFVTDVYLNSRRDVSLTSDVSTGEVTHYKGAIMQLRCEALRGVKLLPEDWDALAEAGCPGPETGRKRYLLFGKPKVTCGLLRLIQEKAIE